VARYLLFYKPYRVLCDWHDEQGRATLADYVPVGGLFEAGRLDYDSEGLLLLTDDGPLAHRLTHPFHHRPKTYLVQVSGLPDEAALRALRSGIPVKGRLTAPAQVELLAGEPDLPPRQPPVQLPTGTPNAWLQMVLREGRKREIRHMTAAAGHPTLRLVRMAIGPLGLGDLQPGQWRDLTPDEVVALQGPAGIQAQPAAAAGPRPKPARRR
jgi:23S rRNA pseudouridine2457 synthase